MRRLAFALAVVVVAGCNQLFGLKETRPLDAAPDGVDGAPDAFSPTLRLVRPVLVRAGQQEMVTTAWSMTDPVPTVQVGTLTGALTTVPIDDDGNFKVPAELLNAPYRVVYTLANDPVPTEIVWNGSDGTFTVPLLGRAGTLRGAVPSGAGLHFDPTGEPATFLNPVVLTTGLWSVTPIAGVLSSPLDVPYPNASSVSLGGPFGALDGSMGDVEVLAVTESGNGATSFAVMAIAQLIANMNVTSSSVWVANPTQASVSPTFNVALLPGRLSVPLGGLPGTTAQSFSGGVLATSHVLAFDQPVPGDLDAGGFLPLYTKSAQTTPMKFANPFDDSNPPAPQLPLAVYASYTSRRTYMGVGMTSGYELCDTTTGGAQTFDFNVGLAQAVTLGGVALSDGASDGVQVASSTSPLPLVFGISATTTIDDCVATLYQVSGSTLVPKYRYQMVTVPTLQAPLPIDGALLEAGTSYTFGLACRLGTHTMNDFTQITLPFVESMVYTAVFTMM